MSDDKMNPLFVVVYAVYEVTTGNAINSKAMLLCVGQSQ